jgi:hypothetical protein
VCVSDYKKSFKKVKGIKRNKMLTARMWRMMLASDTTHGVGTIFAQLEDDRGVEHSAIYRTCCIKAVLLRHQGPLKTKYCASSRA